MRPAHPLNDENYMSNNIIKNYSKVKGWVARETDGSLWLFNEKPSRRDRVAGGDIWIGFGFFPLENLYPELSCNDEPIEVEFLIRKI